VPDSLATHFALVTPGASHTAFGIVSNLSAFFHKSNIISAGKLVFPESSGCTDRWVVD